LQRRPRTKPLTDPDPGPATAARIDATARHLFVQLTAPSGSPAFQRAVERIERVGEREIRAVTELVGRVSQRPLSARDQRDQNDLVSRHIREAEQLAATSGASDLPSSSEQMRALSTALDNDRARLIVMSATLAQEEQALRHEIRTLRKYDALMEALAALLDGDDSAPTIQDVLLSVRQRHADLVSQLTVAQQAHRALHETRQRNVALVGALRTAASSLLSAERPVDRRDQERTVD
jgi:chromosome segregation ATPase